MQILVWISSKTIIEVVFKVIIVITSYFDLAIIYHFFVHFGIRIFIEDVLQTNFIIIFLIIIVLIIAVATYALLFYAIVFTPAIILPRSLILILLKIGNFII